MPNADIGSLHGFDLTHFSLGPVDSTFASGVLTVHPDTDYAAGIITKAPYNIAGSACSFRINDSPGSPVASNELFVGMIDANAIAYGFDSAVNILGWYLVGDSAGAGVWLQPVMQAGGADSSPSGGPFLTTPVVIQVREAAGTTYFESSPDGETWTTVYSAPDALNTTQMGALYFSLCAGFWNTAGGDTGITQHFDLFNGGAPTRSPGDFFGFI